MSLDTLAPLNRILTVVRALPGMQRVIAGVPKNLEMKVSAYVTTGSHTVIDKANNLIQRRARYLITLAYAVDSDPTQSELALAGMIDSLILTLLAERDSPTSPLKSSEIDLTLSDTAEYQQYVGQEYRRFPIAVTVVQQDLYGV